MLIYRKGSFNNNIFGRHKQDLVKRLEIHHNSSQSHERIILLYLQIINVIVWNIRNIRSLFQIKGNVKHYSCFVCQGNCSCVENYVGKSVRNVVFRWAEHEDPNKQSKQLNT